MSDLPSLGPVLDRLALPYDPAKVAAALLGLPLRVARQLVGVSLATSPEAEHLLDEMPRIVRSMAIATTDRPERCYGELRGPVLWSETISARSASAGDPGLYVCATTTKAYDTDENRVLKAALASIRHAAADAEPGTSTRPEAVAPVLRRARQNGHQAAHLLEHRTLADVPVTRVTGRTLRRTRAGSRRATYRPAVELLRRAQHPLRAAEMDSVADPDVRRRAGILGAVLEERERLGHSTLLRSRQGRLVAGPVVYDHREGVSVGGLAVASAAEAATIVARAEGTRPS